MAVSLPGLQAGLLNQSSAQVIDGSLKFDSSKEHYLNRTPSSAGNRRTWTWSGWVKRNKLGTNQIIFESQTDYLGFSFTTDQFRLFFQPAAIAYYLYSNAVFRDVSSWYHFVVVLDTTQSTETDRFKAYVNGEEITWSSASYPTQNQELGVNTSNLHQISGRGASFNGDFQLADVHFIDGQALGPENFGFTDPLTNTWRPKKYTGTFTGTNTFYLPMDGNSPIGEDKSGNGNDWTPVNFGGSVALDNPIVSGALPILNTIHGGAQAVPGTRTDANSSNLFLALPLVGTDNDVSNQINSGSTTKTVAVTGATASTTQSNFYGGSYYFNGPTNGASSATHYAVISDSNNEFAFGTGDFTMEFWVWGTDWTGGSANQDQVIFGHNGVNYAGFYIPAGVFAYYTGSTYIPSSNKPTLQDNKWYHVAVSRESGTSRVFLDGILVGSASDTTNHPTGSIILGRNPSNNLNQFNGYIQDVRVYKGVAKYTSDFVPASTNPDILPDTPSGVSGGSKLTKITDGSFFFSGPNSAIQDASPGYTVGTSAYTFECWAMARSWGDSNIIGLFGFQFGRYASNNGIGIAYATWELYTNWLPNTNLWYHYAVTRDGSGVTRLFINGNLEASATINTNYGAPTTVAVGGGSQATPLNGFDGFISNARFVLGSALYTAKFTPSSTPLESTGAQTKFLGCQSNSSTSSIAVNSGTVSVKGTINASNFNPFNTDINTVRGQETGYCTWNPLNGDKPSGAAGLATLTNGNLEASGNNTDAVGTIGASSGKWYFEVTRTSGGSNDTNGVGFYLSGTSQEAMYRDGALFQYDGSASSYGASWSTDGVVIGVALDLDNTSITFYKDGVSQGVAKNNLPSGTWFPFLLNRNPSTFVANFGQKPFKFPPPDGYQPLNAANVRPSTVIARPDQYVGVTTFTPNTYPSAYTVSNLGFKPDMVWTKSRTGARNHALYDSVRNGAKLYPNENFVENAAAAATFNSDGFTLDPDGDDTVYYSESGVAWCWKAGGNKNTFNVDDVGYASAAAAGLTGGDRTPTGASVGTKQGFSIIKFTGSGSGTPSIPHGLSEAPKFIIQKDTGATTSWRVFAYDGSTWKIGNLNNTDALVSATETAPTSSLFYANGNGNTTNTQIAYLWHDVPGLQKFGSYTGNDSSNFIELGFRPAFIMIKNATKTGSAYSSWMMQDAERSPYNPTSGSNKLWANRSTQEGYRGDGSSTTSLSVNDIDFDSNGFYIPSSASTETNETGQTFIYAAWAEAPTFNLYGGQSNAR